jgi:glyoxalase family protein
LVEEIPMPTTAGLHHVTAFAGDPRRHGHFYRNVLGLRLVKRTVNFDDPRTWHLYYGDAAGSPGSLLTFFLWPHIGAGRNGMGRAVETAFAIPDFALGYWTHRLLAAGVDHDAPRRRFGATVLGLRDPDGLQLELVATPGLDAVPGWSSGEIPAEHAIRGLSGVTLWLEDPAPTAGILTGALGLRALGEDDGRHRFVAAGALGTTVDLRPTPGFLPGRDGRGAVHHVAFRAADDAEQEAMAAALRDAGLRPTEQRDRHYFRSVYAREPGGVLFEIATDAPGFLIDEPAERLGTRLQLPAWFEPNRTTIETALPALD